MSRKHPRRAGLGALMLMLVIFLGPSCIHFFYHLVTPGEVIAAKRLDYDELVDKERHLSPVAQEASIKKRYALFLWFHARGLKVDEGDDASSPWQPWKELVEYWKLGAH